jgi:hypothetical protein
MSDGQHQLNADAGQRSEGAGLGFPPPALKRRAGSWGSFPGTLGLRHPKIPEGSSLLSLSTRETYPFRVK